MSEKLTYDIVVGKNDVSKELKDAANKAFDLETALSSAVGVFAGNIATKGFELVVGAIDGIIGSLSESIDAAAASEVAINNLNAALGRAGNNTQQARDDLAAYAAELQRTTTFEDDAAFGALALLQSLTKLQTEGLKSGVSAASDLATVLGIDLDSAVRLVAKGAEGNVEAFKRYGIEVKKGANDAETFSNLLEQLNRQFGGAAAAQLSTYTGATKALGNNIGDLQESVGGLITNNTTLIGLINVLSGEVAGASVEVAGLQDSTNAITKSFFNFGTALAETILQIGELITAALEPLAESAVFVGGKILSWILLPIEKVIDGVIALGSIVPGLSESFKGLENPIAGLSESLSELADGAINSIGELDGNIFGSLSESVREFGNAVIEAEGNVSAAKVISQQSNKERVASEEEANAQVLEARRALGSEIFALEQQFNIEQSAFKDQLAAQQLEDDLLRNEAQLQLIYDQKLAEAQAVLEGELLKNKALKDAKTKQLADEKAFEGFALANQRALNAKILAEDKLLKDNQAKINKDREANQRDTFSTIATLASSNNKTLAGIGKAAALAQIAIDGPQAVTKALAAFPPPFNYAAATAVGAAVAAQAAKVVGVQFANSGFVGSNGATMGADNTMAQVRSGEMVLNADDQKTLFDAIKSGSLGGGGDIVIKIDEREIVRAVRNQKQAGFVI